MHLALYRAERPERFDEIIGQRHIVKILQNQLATGSVSQAYLFCGTRGTGKTTTARILAKAVNCTGSDDSAVVPCGACPNCTAIKEGKFLDVIELDAASNNGVEDLRAIIDSVQYPPSVGKYKVYIIDEVHMLSQAAENAFLKTLEEPPDYAIFILATTDPDKVRQTIRSRCMTLNFRRVSETDLTAGMRAICDKRAVNIDDEALGVIAARADGSVRDALSLLEQCIAGGDEIITRDLVYEYTGSAGLDFYIDLTERVTQGDIGSALALIDTAIKQGKDAKQLLADWLGHYRDLMISKYVDAAEDIISSSTENISRLKTQAEQISNRELDRALKLLSEENNRARYSGMPRLLLEAAAIRLSGRIEESETDQTERRNPASPKAEAPRPVPVARTEKAALTMAPAPDPTQPVKPTSPTADLPDEPIAAAEEQSASAEPAAAAEEQRASAEPAAASKKQATSAEPATAAEEQGASAESAPASDLDLNEIWQNIASEMAKTDGSFIPMIANHSRITSFRNDEVVLTIKKNKLLMAEAAREDLDRLAKKYFGGNAFFTIKAGDVDQIRMTDLGVAAASSSSAAPIESGSGYLDEGGQEPSIEEVAENLSDLFGMEVTIK